MGLQYNVFTHDCHSQTCQDFAHRDPTQKGGGWGVETLDRAANAVSRNKSLVPGRELSTGYPQLMSINYINGQVSMIPKN